jgi:hypothetical protein
MSASPESGRGSERSGCPFVPIADSRVQLGRELKPTSDLIDEPEEWSDVGLGIRAGGILNLQISLSPEAGALRTV